MPKVIMMIDDDVNNLHIQKSYLEKEYNLITETSGTRALRHLERVIPDLILLDQLMPDMSGMEVLDELKKNEKFRKIPVIVVTSEHDPVIEKECFQHGAADFITKPFAAGVLKERVHKALTFADMQHNLENQIYSKTKEAETVVLQSIRAIANTIDAKDAYTKGHSERVAEYASVIAKELGWEEEEVQLLYNIALLHDIGKIGIPDSILNKPGRLTDEEFAIIKQHTVTGGEILKDVHSMQNAFIAARYHHERYDGKGYPNGLKGNEIPLYARVIAVADAYDAMTSNRVYRKRLSNQKVIEEIKKGMGTQFDPEIARVFVDILVRNADAMDEEYDEKRAVVPNVLSRQQEINQFEQQHDYISGLYNQQYGLKLIAEIPVREEYAICMFTIGGFHSLNRQFGRSQADYVLKETAAVLREKTGEDDIAYRAYGGSFIVCLRNQTEKNMVESICVEILEAFERKRTSIAVMHNISLYAGISMTIQDGRDIHQLCRNADCVIYDLCRDLSSGPHYAFYEERLEVVPAYEDLQGVERLAACVFSSENRKKYLVEGNKELIQSLDQIAQFIRQADCPCTIALYDLVAVKEAIEDYCCSIESLNHLELAAMENLKLQDCGIRFSSLQYVLVLPEEEEDEPEAVMKRIMQQYYRMDSSKKFELKYSYKKGVC